MITAALGGLVAGISDIIGRKWVLVRSMDSPLLLRRRTDISSQVGGIFLTLIGDVVVATAHSPG